MTFKLARVGAVQALIEASNAHDLPGYAIALLQSGECVAHETIGLAELENRTPITSNSRFHVASLAKQFTGFAIGLMEKNGDVKLGDLASDYLPEIEVLKKGITLNHLLRHSSGLRDQWVLLELAGWRGNDTVCQYDVLGILQSQRALNFSPGARFMYSNSGYTLLAEIVSRISGKSFRHYIEENILSPLQMDNSFFADDDNEIISNRSYAYSSHINDSGETVARKFIPNLYTPGATSFITTIEDMIKWDKNFWEVTVGDFDLNVTLRRLGETKPSRKTGYGYGHFYERNQFGEMIFHSGMDFGFQSFYGQYINNDISIIILSNANPNNIFSLAHEIAVSYVGKPIVSSVHFELTETKNIERNLDEYCGVYENLEFDDVWIVERANDELFIRSSGTSTLVPMNDDRFQFSGSPVQCEFNRRDDNAIKSVSIIGVGDDIECVKLGAQLRERADDPEILGKYWSPELDVFSYIKEGSEKCLLSLPKFVSKEITPIYGRLYMAEDAWIRFYGDDGISGFTLSDTRAKRVSFVRVSDELEMA